MYFHTINYKNELIAILRMIKKPLAYQVFYKTNLAEQKVFNLILNSNLTRKIDNFFKLKHLIV